MPEVKFIVIYPHPKDIEAFEKIYQNEHVPMAVAKLAGKTKMVATKVLSSLKVLRRSTASRKCIFHRCRHWKPVQHPMVENKLSHMPFRFRPVGCRFS